MKVEQILETVLYATDLQAIAEFYETVLGLQAFSHKDDRSVFFQVGGAMLLYFNPEHTSRIEVKVGEGTIPLHGAEGAGHVCFSAKESEIDYWKDRLTQRGVAIESELRWSTGTRSIYFRDPAGNCLEFASPRLWGLAEPD